MKKIFFLLCLSFFCSFLFMRACLCVRALLVYVCVLVMRIAFYFFLATIFLGATAAATGIAETDLFTMGESSSSSSSSSESSTSTSCAAEAPPPPADGMQSSSCDWNLDGAAMRRCSSSSRVMWHLPRREGLGFKTACTKRQVTPKLPPANHRPPHVMMSAASEPLTMRSLGDLPSLLGNKALLLES